MTALKMSPVFGNAFVGCKTFNIGEMISKRSALLLSVRHDWN